MVVSQLRGARLFRVITPCTPVNMTFVIQMYYHPTIYTPARRTGAVIQSYNDSILWYNPTNPIFYCCNPTNPLELMEKNTNAAV
jgi:hypothetical protein